MDEMEAFDAFYGKEELSFGDAPTLELKDLVLSRRLRGRALDLGSGDGRNALFLAENDFDVTTTDISRVGLRKLTHFAQEKGLADRVHATFSDVRTWTFPEDAFSSR
jgi:cyclopropane fatty-acyl-phospholipid synthase-like methyltransferase